MANLTYESYEGWTKILFCGDITCELSQKVKPEAEALLASLGNNPVLVCDLSQVRFLDSSGIGLLVFLNNKLRQKSGRFFLYQPSEAVRKILELVQLLAFFELVDDEVELLTQLP